MIMDSIKIIGCRLFQVRKNKEGCYKILLKTIERFKSGEKVFIVCAGDSITEQNHHTNGRLNYVGQLNTRLIESFGRNGFVLNAGISANTSWDLINRLDNDVLRLAPDLVTIMIGINDSKFGVKKIPEFKSNLETIIEKVNRNKSEILLLTQNPLSYEVNDNVVNRGSYPYYTKEIRDLAQEKGVPLCDIQLKWDEYMGDDIDIKYWHMMDDFLHPNEYGHNFIAEALFEYLKI